MRRGLLLLLLCTCSLAAPGAPARSGGAAGRARALRWADRRYREAVADSWHPSGFRDPHTRLEFNDAAVAFEHVRYRYGPSREAELGLARSLERLCNFAEAVAAYRGALRLAPRNPEAIAGMRRCRLLVKEARLIRAGEGYRTLFDALPIHPAGEAPAWLMVSGLGGGGAETEGARLHLVRPGAGPPRLLWAAKEPSGAVGETPDPEFGRGVDFVGGEELYLRRLSPPGGPLVFALVGQYPMAGTTETQLIVFRLTGTRLERVWAVAGTINVVLLDRDRDGWLEIGYENEVGYDMCHASQPRWTDWFAWDGRGFRSVNRRYRATFREVAQQIQEIRSEAPADPDLVAHLGQLHEMYGRRRAAAYAYGWAITECSRRLHKDNAADVRALLRDTQARLQKLER